jgi:hypothetical protein
VIGGGCKDGTGGMKEEVVLNARLVVAEVAAVLTVFAADI